MQSLIDKEIRQSSNIRRIVIPKGWKKIRIGEIGDEKNCIVDGPFGSNLKTSDYDEKGEVPVISITNIEEGFSKETLRFITKEKFKTLARSAVKPGDIIMAKIGSTYGKCCYYPSHLPVGMIPANIIKISVSKKVNKDFVFYYFKSELFKKDLDLIVKITAQPSFSLSSFKTLEFLLPSPDEQRKIASILSKVDELIQKTDEIIKQTQGLRRGLMQRLLIKGIGHTKFKKEKFYDKLLEIPEGWHLGKLGEHTLKIGSGITPRGGSKVYQKSGIPLIRSQNVHFDGLRLDDVAFITDEIDEEMKNSRTQVNDVLLNITGASVGRCTYVPPVLRRGNVNQHVCIIRPNKNIDSTYLSSFLSSSLGQSIIHRSYHGLSREGLTFSQIASFLILIPPIQEQIIISAFFTSMNSQILNQTEIKLNLDRLKKGLMQKLLTGKIRIIP